MDIETTQKIADLAASLAAAIETAIGQDMALEQRFCSIAAVCSAAQVSGSDSNGAHLLQYIASAYDHAANMVPGNTVGVSMHDVIAAREIARARFGIA